MLTRVALTASIAAALAAAPPAHAVIPPKDCGSLTVKSKRYTVKADQLSCATAKRYTTRYLAQRTRPRGYSCRRYRNTRLVFRCHRGVREFFAIRR